MRIISLVLTIAIVAFWMFMNALLWDRERDLRANSRSLRAVNEFLGSNLRRERWLEIYRHGKKSHHKVGYSGYSIEKEYTSRGIQYRAEIELLLSGFLPKIGLLPSAVIDSSRLAVSGRILLDKDFRARELRVRVSIRLLKTEDMDVEHDFLLTGEARESDRHPETGGESDASDRMLRVALRRGESTLLEFDLPATDIVPSDGLVPLVALGELELHQKYEVKVFDPLSVVGPSDRNATIEVVEERTVNVNGTPVDVFVVDMRWKRTVVQALVTRDGNIVREEIPRFGLILEHAENRAEAVKGIEP